MFGSTLLVTASKGLSVGVDVCLISTKNLLLEDFVGARVPVSGFYELRVETVLLVGDFTDVEGLRIVLVELRIQLWFLIKHLYLVILNKFFKVNIPLLLQIDLTIFVHQYMPACISLCH